METIRISQALDTEVRVFVNWAFASMTLRFLDMEERPVEVVLDVESGIRVLEGMDNGYDAIRRLPPRPRRPVFAVVVTVVLVVAVALVATWARSRV